MVGRLRALLASARTPARWLARRWRRSLQFRVATSTALVSGLVVLVVGVVLLGQISGGLLDTKRQAALAEANEGLQTASNILAVATSSNRHPLSDQLYDLVTNLSAKGSRAGLFDVVLLPRSGDQDPVKSGEVDSASVPSDLRAQVADSHQAYAYGPIRRGGGDTAPGLIVGEPVVSPVGTYGLYYLFPLQSEQRTLDLVQRTVLVAGLVLVLLVVAIAALVTRQVVQPVRTTAHSAGLLADGNLEERMTVHGEDDLARLASSFNEMADALQRQITKLEELSRVQRRFTSDVSHELRTPLTTVRMAADLLHGAREDFPAGIKRAAELLQAELDRFETLLADLLEISRHDAQAAELEAEQLDLRPIVERVVDGAAALAARAGSDLVVRLPPVPVVAQVDPRRVERVLRNLLGNALEHGNGLPVEITLTGNEEAVAVTVRDHGIGFRPEEAALVFNRFWRADPSRARRTGGTGLGLAISEEDARLHHGWLHAWGRPGEGAQFRLTLPVRAGVEPRTSPLPLEPADLTGPTAIPSAPGGRSR